MKNVSQMKKQCLFLLLACLPLLSLAQGPDGVTVAGGNGVGPAANQFYFSTGVFVDGAGNVFVADQFNHRIQKFAPGSTSGLTVAGGNGPGSAANQLNAPTGVFVDGAGNVFVADFFNDRIQKFAPGTTVGVTVAGGEGNGPAANQLSSPFGVFVDGAGNLFVSDRNNHRIQKFAPGSTSGVTVAGGNGQGSAASQLDSPTGVFVDGAGNVFVADFGNHRIQKFAPGSTSGVTVAGGNGVGPAANQLNAPTGVFVDGAGNVFVADQGNHRIQKFAPGTTSGVTVAGGNGQGSAASQLAFPYGVFVDGAGNVFVADFGNHRIQKFAPSCPAVGVSGATSVVFGFKDGDNCTTLTASTSGGTAPFTYSWKINSDEIGDKASQRLCPESTTTYTVTATEANGCASAPTEVTVNVQDVRCGNKLNKVEICYYGVTQCVSNKIAKRYLRLGATIGGCGTNNAARLGVPESSELPLQLSLKAYPNPVQDAVTVEVLSPSAGQGTFEVLDVSGRVMKSRKQNLIEGLNEVQFRLGSLPTGIYLIRGVDALNHQGVVRVKKE